MELLKVKLHRDHSPPFGYTYLYLQLKSTIMKMLLTGFILALSVTAKCQLDKKTWLVGGTGNFSSSKKSFGYGTNFQTSNSTTIKISPNIGYFVFDKLAGGIKTSFSFFSEKVDGLGGSDGNVTRFEFGPFLRYYFLKKEKRVNIISEVSYQYGTYSTSPSKSKGSINTFSFLSGPVIFFNESVGMEFLLGYGSRVESVEQEYKDSQKSFLIAIGFQFHLQK